METSAPLESKDTCATAKQAILKHGFDAWTGDMESCSWQNIFPGYRVTDELPRRLIGDDFVATRFIGLPLEGYHMARLSFEEGRWVMFDGMLTELDSIATTALLTALGAPAAKLDWYFGTLPMAETEWVYPEKGITLFLRDDLELVLHVALYASMTLEAYEATRRLNLRKRRR
ncbi:MAG: hypothetical protein AAFV07_18195 [Bacteroidota bacterium]